MGFNSRATDCSKPGCRLMHLLFAYLFTFNGSFIQSKFQQRTSFPVFEGTDVVVAAGHKNTRDCRKSNPAGHPHHNPSNTNVFP